MLFKASLIYLRVPFECNLLRCHTNSINDCNKFFARDVALQRLYNDLSVAFHRSAKTSVGYAKTSVGYAKTSVGYAKTSVGYAKTSVGYAKTSVGYAKTSTCIVNASGCKN